MLIKLNESYEEQVIEYLSKEASINLFIIGDIENYGFNNDFQDVWGSFDNENNIKGVLLRYYESFITYFEEECEDKKEIVKYIKDFKFENIFISGKESVINAIRESFEGLNIRNTYFCELKSKSNLLNDDGQVKVANVDDIVRISDFMNTIEEFDMSLEYEKKLKKELENKSGRVYYIEDENGEIVCSAQATAENYFSAMIVGVATGERFRNQGYTTKCLSKLICDLLDEEKTVCLFYSNPKAGRIYHNLGFKNIENWTLITK